MEDKNVPRDVLVKRLRRIEGQIRGIEKMIMEERDCVSLITQLAAVRSGIEGIGALVLNNCMKMCFTQGEQAPNNFDELTRAVGIWGRVRSSDG